MPLENGLNCLDVYAHEAKLHFAQHSRELLRVQSRKSVAVFTETSHLVDSQTRRIDPKLARKLIKHTANEKNQAERNESLFNSYKNIQQVVFLLFSLFIIIINSFADIFTVHAYCVI